MAKRNFNDLLAFVTVAREGSFTRASKALRIQQPAISKMVRQLENSLGLVLFVITITAAAPIVVFRFAYYVMPPSGR